METVILTSREIGERGCLARGLPDDGYETDDEENGRPGVPGEEDEDVPPSATAKSILMGSECGEELAKAGRRTLAHRTASWGLLVASGVRRRSFVSRTIVGLR